MKRRGKLTCTILIRLPIERTERGQAEMARRRESAKMLKRGERRKRVV